MFVTMTARLSEEVLPYLGFIVSTPCKMGGSLLSYHSFSLSLFRLLKALCFRLSRKQLPSVDMDGTVRYSSPVDQVETDWISGSIFKNNASSSSPLSSASSSTPSVNYWMHNLRHDNTFNNGSTLIQQLSASNVSL